MEILEAHMMQNGNSQKQLKQTEFVLFKARHRLLHLNGIFAKKPQ